MIKNRFAELLFEKRRKENRNISIAEISRATGISKKILTGWELNKGVRFCTPSIKILCDFFEVETGPLFIENGIKNLLAEKERKENRKITISEISRTIGITPDKITRWLKNGIFFSIHDIEVLCDFLEAEAGPFFSYVKEEKPQASKPGFIRSNYKTLLEQKELRDGHKYSEIDIFMITGKHIHSSSLRKFGNRQYSKAGDSKYISFGALSAMCHFLECSPADLLEYVPAEMPAKKQAA